jgi:hypothetical protein
LREFDGSVSGHHQQPGSLPGSGHCWELTVDCELTKVHDVADVALLFAGFNSNALTGQSLVVSHSWFMQ